ncbi:MAG: phospholipid-binding protein MlaC [Granulosicoccus sp.]
MFKRIQCFLCAMALTVASSVTIAADHPAQTLVVDAISSMLEVFKEDGDKLKSDPAYLKAKVDELIVPNLDFETMTKLAVSKFWRRADKEQQQVLVEEFTTLLLNTYTGALTEYSGESITFDPFKPESREDRAVVSSTFSQSAGDDVPVLYKLRDKNGWSIYDIEVNDISLVTSYRSAFSSEIEKGGIDGLIKALKDRNGKS